MKICFIYNSVFRHGGVQRVIANLVNSLANNHEVSILCNEEFDINKNFYGIDLDKVNVYYRNILSNNSLDDNIKNIYRKILIVISNIAPKLVTDKMINKYYSDKTKKNFIELINQNNYDIVIGCMMRFNLLLALVKKDLNCNVIGWENNSYDSYFSDNKFNIKSPKKIYSYIIAKLEKFIVLTEVDKIKYNNQFNIQPVVIPNPLGLTCIDKSDCNKKVILYVGRIELVKGTDLLIDIFEKFSRKHPEWVLNIVGGGVLYKEIKSKIREKNLDNQVHIHSFTENIQKKYTQASIYACTSRFESFGLSVIEAMECGIPVVSFNTSGPSEIITNNKNGIIVDQFDIDKYVNALEKIADDDDFRKKLARNAIKRAKDYNIDNIIIKWNEILS